MVGTILAWFVACSDYMLGGAADTAEEKSRAEMQNPSADFSLTSACESLDIYLPGLASENGESFYGACPLDTATTTYTADDSGRLTACTTVLDSRAKNLSSRATQLFWDDFDPAALLDCKIPLTVFIALERAETGEGHDAVLTEKARMWVTLGYNKENSELAVFETQGLVDEAGQPTDRFPIDAIYLGGTHEHPVGEFEDKILDRESARTVNMNVAVLPAGEVVAAGNSFGFDFSCDGADDIGLILADNADNQDGEMLVYSSSESEDYSLATNRTTVPELVAPLLESAATFCEVDASFRGTKYCVEYFSDQ